MKQCPGTKTVRKYSKERLSAVPGGIHLVGVRLPFGILRLFILNDLRLTGDKTGIRRFIPALFLPDFFRLCYSLATFHSNLAPSDSGGRQLNKELNILKWVGIALAVISTIFTLAIVGAHLSGRLVGIGKVGLIGIVGAELMAIVCAWLAASERKKIAGVAMVCQIILTAVLLINASIAIDLTWQETLSDKASQRSIAAQRLAAEEQRKLIEKQAELAGQLAQTDKRLAREFVRSGKSNVQKMHVPTEPAEQVEAAPIDVAKLSVYERYGLTIVPLFLAMLTVIALALAAHSESASVGSEFPREIEVGK